MFLCNFVPVLVALVVLYTLSFFSTTSQEIGWEERLRRDLFCIEWDANLSSIDQSINQAAVNTSLHTTTTTTRDISRRYRLTSQPQVSNRTLFNRVRPTNLQRF